MSDINNIFILVRGKLQANAIKLWEEPYYLDDVGPIETEMERLSNEFSHELGISKSKCNCALNELQDSAIRKLAARKEFNETGMATFSVRCISVHGTKKIIEVKCELNQLGADLHAIIAARLKLSNANLVKCIAAGRIIVADRTLESQGIKNNQQLMVMVGSDCDSDKEKDKEDNADDDNQPSCSKQQQHQQQQQQHNSEALYVRVRRIKADVEAIVDSDQQLMELEDQGGNAVFMPPSENRAMLLGLGYIGKARAAMRRAKYDEALLLLLEADEQFSLCQSQFLESTDNYGLLNLDIVWCYLALKNLAQLPDAAKRLSICERVFRRSYGDNYERLIALKGSACPERALIVRLHLLQGVVYFHQNRRDEAYERLESAGSELHDLRIYEVHVQTLVEMGYKACDARIALRACSGDVEQALQFIHENNEKLQEAHQKSVKEREVQREILKQKRSQHDDNWVNARSVCTLMEMGYERELVVEALRRTKNDIPLALTLLQTNADELRAALPSAQSVDENLLSQLLQLGFDENNTRLALQTSENNLEKSIDFLFSLRKYNGVELSSLIERLSDMRKTLTDSDAASLIERLLEKATAEMEIYNAVERYHVDGLEDDNAYLDLPLDEEERILNEYKKLLEN